MAFVAARCPSCGANLQLDNGQEKGFCQYCGTQIVVQEAIKKIRIDNSHMVDNWMNMAMSAYDAGNMEEAYEYFTKSLKYNPQMVKPFFIKVCLQDGKLR